MNQSQRTRRGDDFLPECDELIAIPLLGDTENVALEDKIIHLHYFLGSCDWYIAEIDNDS
jgi:hypothetical protein